MGLSLLNLDKQIILEYVLLSLNSLTINFVLLFDWVSFLFIRFVFFISGIIIKYRFSYIEEEDTLDRFVNLILLFVFSMAFIIFRPNLVSVLLGWDGLGLVSYALVIYYQNIKSFNAGILTALSNRVGDRALLIGVGCIITLGGWNLLNFGDFFKNELRIVIGFIILAAITKRAQVPFSAWLPSAIAAPTPVSSLVHSSTLVTAGVYLLFRFRPFFRPKLLKILLYLSIITIFIAGVAANFEYDLKKIIALSTLSQLGIMIFILCLGRKDLAFFHLLVHAFFKALLFICAGAIIHNLHNRQDIRDIGGLIYFMPVTCICLNVRSFALCGLPFLSGFYSKDLIAEALRIRIFNLFIYFLFFISVGLTVSYSFRLFYYLFMTNCKILNLHYLRESNNKIILDGILGLVRLVVVSGRLLMWVLFPVPYFIILPILLKLLTLTIVLMGIILGYEISQVKFYYKIKVIDLKYSLFFFNIWNLLVLSVRRLTNILLKLGNFYYKRGDQGWLEYYGRKGLFTVFLKRSQFLQLWSKFHNKKFLFIIFIFVLVYFVINYYYYLNSLKRA